MQCGQHLCSMNDAMKFVLAVDPQVTWAAEAKHYWGGTTENVKVRYYPIPLSFLPAISRKLTLER